MVCPYNRKSLKYIKKYSNDLVNEETGIIRSNTETVVEEYTMMECPQENCGAWRNGKCNYYQENN